MQWLYTHSVYNKQQIIQKETVILKRVKSLDSDHRDSNFWAPGRVFTVSTYYRQLGVTKPSGAQTILGVRRLFQYLDILPELVMINKAVLMYYGRAVIMEYAQSLHIIVSSLCAFPHPSTPLRATALLSILFSDHHNLLHSSDMQTHCYATAAIHATIEKLLQQMFSMCPVPY